MNKRGWDQFLNKAKATHERKSQALKKNIIAMALSQTPSLLLSSF